METKDIVAGIRHYRHQMQKLIREGELDREEVAQFKLHFSSRSNSMFGTPFNIHSIIKGFESGTYAYFCSCCGKPASTNYFGNERMIEHKLCFGCNLWDKRSQDQASSIIAMYQGSLTLFSKGSNTAPHNTKHNGFGGSLFKFRRYKDDSVVMSNNMWHGGSISYFWRDKFEENAVFLETPTMVEYCDMFFDGQKDRLVSQFVGRTNQQMSTAEAKFHLSDNLWDVERTVRKYHTTGGHEINMLKEFVPDEDV